MISFNMQLIGLSTKNELNRPQIRENVRFSFCPNPGKGVYVLLHSHYIEKATTQGTGYICKPILKSY